LRGKRQDALLAGDAHHGFVADGGFQLSGAAEQLGVGGQARDRAWAAGRAVHPPADHQRVAHGLAGVDVQTGRRAGQEAPHAQEQLGSGHRVHVRGHRHRQAQRVGQHLSDRRLPPAQSRVVHLAGGAVDGATDGNPDPQRPPPMPTPQVAACAVGQRHERGPGRVARRRGLDGVEGAAEQVGGHDAGGARTDVDAQRHERLVVDLHRHARAADRAGDGQVGALPQQAGFQQGDDLTVDRRDAQRGDAGDDVTTDRSAQPDGPKDGGRRGVGDVQRRRHDLSAHRAVTVLTGRIADSAIGRKMGRGEDIGAHGRPLSDFCWPAWPHLAWGQGRQSAQQQHAPAAHRHAAVVMLDRAL